MALVDEYADKIRPLLPLAKKAYGRRDTDSPNHEASREYTRLLVEFHKKKGSLPELAAKLGVAYAGLQRRVSTKDVPIMHRTTRTKFSPAEYKAAALRIKAAKRSRNTVIYHDAIKAEYEKGFSLTTLARDLGLSSAHPLYYGLSRAVLREQQAKANI